MRGTGGLLSAWILLSGLPVVAGDFPWPTATPRQHGLSGPKLEAMRDALAARKTRALLVVRHDKIVYEWYAPGGGPNQRQGTASLAKALVGGMSLLVALTDGRIQPDDPAWKYIPAWRPDPQKSKITIRHLATHSSGIEDAQHVEQPEWMSAFWRRKAPDPFTVSLHQAPMLFSPGQRFHYSNPGMAALAYAVTASLRGAPQSDIQSLLRARIMDPLGIPEDHWAISYGEAFELDGLKLYANWGGGRFTPRAAARVGQLMLHGGRWAGRRLLDREWVRKVVAYAGTPLPDRREAPVKAATGLCWWTNADGVWPKVPRDAFAGSGAGDQKMVVIPSLDLIVVRNGESLGGPDWSGALEYLLNPLMDALIPGAVSPPPYPMSAVIRKVTFAPESTIVRKAIDSDNWPITWADDGDLYTSFGDGWGFDPRTEIKLSLGLAKVTGPPADFQGINIRSETGERTGDGRNGPKASGMLMIGGVLYMWVRNTGNAGLAWSEDRGRTWQWGFQFDTSFGSPAFLNFGRNYAGARDNYVYTYSQDGPSAYDSDDRLVLARVHKSRIRERSAYEFFTALDGSGRPIWTKEISGRGGVFNYPGRCQRVDVVYNRGLKRYLLALGYNHRGGWGFYDAAEPWGPWTTAFHTDHWNLDGDLGGTHGDLGGTHGYRLPSKWISPNGRTMHLVFSGVRLPHITWDAFCVRRLTLE